MTDARRASDDLLLRLLREGRHDSEIAVQFGSSTGELRERKADLRNRLGVERYQELAGTAPKREASSRRRLFFWGMGIAAGMLALLLVIANIFGREPGPDAAPERSTALPTSHVLQPPAILQVEGQQFEDLGQFVVAAGGPGEPIGTISNRAALAVVSLTGRTFLGGGDVVEWLPVRASRNEAFLRVTLPDRQVDVAVYTERPQGRLRELGADVGLILEVFASRAYQAPPTLVLRATQGGQVLPIRITSDGRLLVGRAFVDHTLVIDGFTGGTLDVSRAQPFGSIPRSAPGSTQNACDTPPAIPEPRAVECRLVWLRTNRGFVTPVDGGYSCAGARNLRFEADGVRLDFILANDSVNSFVCEKSDVVSGTTIVPEGDWVVRAFNAADEPVAIVAAGDGRVYVGDVRSSVGCPCLPRPN